MPMSMSQKIIARASGRNQVKPGDHVIVQLDMVFSHDPVMAVLKSQFESTFGSAGRVWDPSRIALFQDHLVPAKNAESAKMLRMMDEFVEQQKIQFYFPYGGNYGVCHIVMMEQGLALPGEVITGPDSHTVTYGAFNSFASGLGIFDIAVAMGTGRAWITVPDAIRVNVEGTLKRGVGAKDIILELIRRLRLDGARGKSIEWYGSTIENMNLDERATLCNMVVEAGATNGIMNLNRAAKTFLRQKAKREFTEQFADAAYQYNEIIEINVNDLEPRVAMPHSPDNVVGISKLEQEKINLHQVYVGSCTGGKWADIVEFAQGLGEHRVSPGLRVIVAPATTEIYMRMIDEGLMKTLISKGVAVESPGCRACYGVHSGVTGDSEVCLATINRNFMGRMGNPKSLIYLSSPYVAARSAIHGYITAQ